MKNIAIVINPESKMNHNYVAAVEAVGARHIMLDWSGAVSEVKNCCGIIITGGVDINPSLYGEENTDSVCVNDVLDDFEIRVIDVAVKNNVPVLGVCRGLQLLNVYFGGTLIQNVAHCDIHKREADKDKIHLSYVEGNSFLYDVYGQNKLNINSAHHQAIKKLANGFRAVQHSEDNLIEAVEHEVLPIYGVQWHPERTCLSYARADVVDGLQLFKWFTHICGAV